MADKFGYVADGAGQQALPEGASSVGGPNNLPQGMTTAEPNTLPDINIKPTNDMMVDDEAAQAELAQAVGATAAGGQSGAEPNDLAHMQAAEQHQLQAEGGAAGQDVLPADLQNSADGIGPVAGQLMDPEAMHARNSSGGNLPGPAQGHDFALPQDDDGQHPNALAQSHQLPSSDPGRNA